MRRKEKIVVVHDKIQKGYSYRLIYKPGCNFDPSFKPSLTPKQMLELGVFGGKYMTDCRGEFPTSWYTRAKLSPQKKNPSLNYFGVDASQPLSLWKNKGWINEKHDPRGWFQWYCRYHMGRRLLYEDEKQIKRWKNMRRHIAQIKKHCAPRDYSCRKKQRQAILHWAYDSRKM